MVARNGEKTPGCRDRFKLFLGRLHMARFSGRHYYRSLLILLLLAGISYPVNLLYNSFGFAPAHEFVGGYTWGGPVAAPTQLQVNLQGGVLLLNEVAGIPYTLRLQTFHTFAQMKCSTPAGSQVTTCEASGYGSSCKLVKDGDTLTLSGSHTNEDVITANFCQLRMDVAPGTVMTNLVVDGQGVAYFTTDHNPANVIDFGGNGITVTGSACDVELSYLNLNTISVSTTEGIIDLQEVTFNQASLTSSLNSVVVSTANSLAVTYRIPSQTVCMHADSGLELSTCNATVGNSTSCSAVSYMYNAADTTTLLPSNTAPARTLSVTSLAGDINVRVGQSTSTYMRVGPGNNGVLVPRIRSRDQQRITSIFSSDTNVYDIVRFEVRGSGVPGGLFSWAKKRAFLALDPALLSVVSADLLTPKRIHMKIYMSPGYCPIDRVAAGKRIRLVDETLHTLGVDEWSKRHPDSSVAPVQTKYVDPRPATRLAGVHSDTTPLRLLATPAEALQVSRQTQVYVEIDRVLGTVSNLEDGVVAYQHSCEKMSEFVVSSSTGGFEKKEIHWSTNGSIMAILIFAAVISIGVGAGATFTIFHFMTKSMDEQRGNLKEQLIQLRTQGVFPLEDGWYAFFPWPYSFYPTGPRPTKEKTQKDVHQRSVAEALQKAQEVDQKIIEKSKANKKSIFKRESTVSKDPPATPTSAGGEPDLHRDTSDSRGQQSVDPDKSENREPHDRNNQYNDDYSDYPYSDYSARDDGGQSLSTSDYNQDDGGYSEDYSDDYSDLSTGAASKKQPAKKNASKGKSSSKSGSQSGRGDDFTKSLPFGIGGYFGDDGDGDGDGDAAKSSDWFGGFFEDDDESKNASKKKSKKKDPVIVLHEDSDDDESSEPAGLFGMFNFAGDDKNKEGFFSSLFSGETEKKRKKSGLFSFMGGESTVSETEDAGSMDEEEEEYDENDFDFDEESSDDDDSDTDIWAQFDADDDISSEDFDFDNGVDEADFDAFGDDEDNMGDDDDMGAAVILAAGFKKNHHGRKGGKKSKAQKDQMLPSLDMAKWYFKVKVPKGENAALETPDIRVFQSCLSRADGGRNTDVLRALLTQTHQSLPFRALGMDRAERVLLKIWDKALKNYLIERQAEEKEPEDAIIPKKDPKKEPDIIDPRLVAPPPKPESIDTAHYREEDQKSRPYSKELKYIDMYIGPFTLVEIFIDAVSDQLQELMDKGKNLGISAGDVMSFVSENKKMMKDPKSMADRTLNFILREVMELLMDILGANQPGGIQHITKTPLPTEGNLKDMPDWLKENADSVLNEIVRQVTDEFGSLARRATMEFKKVVFDSSLMLNNIKEILKTDVVDGDDRPILDCLKSVNQAAQIVHQLVTAINGAMDNAERVVFWVQEITMQAFQLRSKILKDLRDESRNKSDYPVVAWVGQVKDIKNNAHAARRNMLECVKKIRAAREALSISTDRLPADGTSILKKVNDIKTKLEDALRSSSSLLSMKDDILKKLDANEGKWKNAIKKLPAGSLDAKKFEKKLEGLVDLRRRVGLLSEYQKKVEDTMARFAQLPVEDDLIQLKGKIILNGKVQPKNDKKGLSRVKKVLGVWGSHTLLVFMNFFMLLIPTVPLFTGLILVQRSYGRDPEQNICFGSGRKILATAMTSLCLVYYAIGVIKLWFFFTDANTKLRVIWRKVFYISSTIFLVTSASWFFFFISWVILGLVFKPERAIPYVVAIGSLGSFVMLQLKRAKDIRQRLYVNVKRRIQESLESMHLTATFQEQKNFLMRAFSMVGLSKETILVKIVFVVNALIVVFAFIFLGMSVFQSPGAVASAIGGILSGIAGGASMLLGRKSPGDLDQLVAKAEELVNKGIDITLNELKKREDEVRKLEVIRILGNALDIYTTVIGSGEKTKAKVFGLLETIHYPTNEPPSPCRSSCNEHCHHGKHLVGSAKYIWDGLRAAGYGARIWADDNKKTPGQMAIWITRGVDLEDRKEWVAEQLIRIESEYEAKQATVRKGNPFEMLVWWPHRKDETKKVEHLDEERHYEGELEHGSKDGGSLLKKEAKDLWVTLEAQGFSCRINEAPELKDGKKLFQIVITGTGTKVEGTTPEKKTKKKKSPRETVSEVVNRVMAEVKNWKELEERGETHIVALHLQPEHCVAGKPPPRLGRNPDRLTGEAKIIWNALSVRGFNAIIDFATDAAGEHLSRAIVVKPPFKILDQEALEAKKKEREEQAAQAAQNGETSKRPRRDSDDSRGGRGRRDRGRGRSRSRRGSYDSYDSRDGGGWW